MCRSVACRKVATLQKLSVDPTPSLEKLFGCECINRVTGGLGLRELLRSVDTPWRRVRTKAASALVAV